VSDWPSFLPPIWQAAITGASRDFLAGHVFPNRPVIATRVGRTSVRQVGLKPDLRPLVSRATCIVALGVLLTLSPLLAHALPAFTAVKATHTPSEAWLLDRHGEVIQAIRINDQLRRLPWVSLDSLSPAMTQALLVSEDRRFMQHDGVDWRALVAAMWDNLSGASHRGASTLTMQLAGLLKPQLHRPAGGRSLAQKWDQMKEARTLEKTWTKQQILEAYLNRVHFRGELAGIHAAARGLFHKHPSGLTKAEASLLAALLRGPNAQPEVVAKRACGVAAQLATPRPACASIQRLARVALASPPRLDLDEQLAPQLAPHFARQFLARHQASLKTPLKGGERLATSLDARLQRLAQTALDTQLAELRGRQASDGAVVVLDNATGSLLAYVGASRSTSLSPEVDGVLPPGCPAPPSNPSCMAWPSSKACSPPPPPWKTAPWPWTPPRASTCRKTTNGTSRAG